MRAAYRKERNAGGCRPTALRQARSASRKKKAPAHSLQSEPGLPVLRLIRDERLTRMPVNQPVPGESPPSTAGPGHHHHPQCQVKSVSNSLIVKSSPTFLRTRVAGAEAMKERNAGGCRPTALRQARSASRKKKAPAHSLQSEPGLPVLRLIRDERLTRMPVNQPVPGESPPSTAGPGHHHHPQCQVKSVSNSLIVKSSPTFLRTRVAGAEAMEGSS